MIEIPMNSYVFWWGTYCLPTVAKHHTDSQGCRSSSPAKHIAVSILLSGPISSGPQGLWNFISRAWKQTVLRSFSRRNRSWPRVSPFKILWCPKVFYDVLYFHMIFYVFQCVSMILQCFFYDFLWFSKISYGSNYFWKLVDQVSKLEVKKRLEFGKHYNNMTPEIPHSFPCNDTN